MQLILGDCLEAMRGMEPNSVDAIVTDPPAGISFMGKEWDKDKGGRGQWIAWMTEIAAECLRVIKPGGHALVWALPRTSHWTATAWEDAGFEVRDRIAHVFGSGFPKSLDVSKAIDKAAGKERERHLVPTKRGNLPEQAGPIALGATGMTDISEPITDAAKQWDGWGTALKPAMEDWWLLRKPLSEKTVAANVLKWGTGSINIDGCRVDAEPWHRPRKGTGSRKFLTTFAQDKWTKKNMANGANEYGSNKGRWPANLIHDGSEEVLALFPEAGGGFGKRGKTVGNLQSPGSGWGTKNTGEVVGFGDSGSAARFFYCAKASRAEREAGLEGMEAKSASERNGMSSLPDLRMDHEQARNGSRNHHPTVKPLALMRYLCRLITPPNGLILDPFMGSGSTGMAAKAEGFRFIGIEKEKEYVAIAERRIGATG
jgi:site-specific DNA-methyltransferase (adenine-specific)